MRSGLLTVVAAIVPDFQEFGLAGKVGWVVQLKQTMDWTGPERSTGRRRQWSTYRILDLQCDHCRNWDLQLHSWL